MTEHQITKDFCVYGDSIAYGYRNDDISWFDLLKQNHNISGSKLAQNGDKIANVLQKISKDSNCYDYLIFAVGINDLLQNNDNFNISDNTKLLSQYNMILSKASSITKQQTLLFNIYNNILKEVK